MAACEFKACPREAIWQYPDINQRVMVCRYHALFMDEENGEFDMGLRESLASHTSHRGLPHRGIPKDKEGKWAGFSSLFRTGNPRGRPPIVASQ